jgi:hypothetical protein
MKHYYYSVNNQQQGPFTLDELKVKRLKKSTLVWTDGLKEWTTGDNIDELKEFVISEPPPLPVIKTIETDNVVKIKLTPHDISNENNKEPEATLVGIILLLIPIFIKLSGSFNFETEESYNQTRAFFAIGSLIIRIFGTIWVVSIANRLNRNSSGWGWFAFFFPSIALISIGLLNKLPLNINIDSTLSIDEQTSILKQKVNELISDLRFIEALSILHKIKELKSDYPMIDEEIIKCKSKIEEVKNTSNKKQEKVEPKIVLYKYETSKGKLEIEQNHNSYSDINIGKKALLNGHQAPNGKYKVDFMWYVHIENGIVTKTSII